MRKVFLIIGGVLLMILGIAVWNYHADVPVAVLKAQYTYPDSKFIDIDGMPVHYRRTGAGPSLLLLHGTGASLHTWEGWTERLQDSFELVSVDLPAFGLTGPQPQGDYSIGAYVHFVEAFTQAVGVDSFHLAGNSLGGLIAWEYALAHPEKVRKLILIDAAGWPKTTPVSLGFRLARMPVVGDVLEKVTPRAMFYKSLREVYYNDDKVTDSLTSRYFDLFLRQGNREAFVARARQPQHGDPQRLAGFNHPTLLQWGAEDAWIPLADAYRFQEVLPQAELIVYPETGHVPMEERPEETARDVRAFLGR